MVPAGAARGDRPRRKGGDEPRKVATEELLAMLAHAVGPGLAELRTTGHNFREPVAEFVRMPGVAWLGGAAW